MLGDVDRSNFQLVITVLSLHGFFPLAASDARRLNKIVKASTTLGNKKLTENVGREREDNGIKMFLERRDLYKLHVLEVSSQSTFGSSEHLLWAIPMEQKVGHICFTGSSKMLIKQQHYLKHPVSM